MFDGHRRHSVVSVLEYVLALQSLQTSALAAIDVETLPAVHCVQAAGPMLALNLPATQGSHVSPSGPVCPLLQVQLDSVMLADADPEFAGHKRHTVLSVLGYVLALQCSQRSAVVAAVAVETLPAGHWVHRAAPTLSLNFPATHAVHGPPSGPGKPLSHLQSDSAMLDDADREFAGQSLHTAAPSELAYLPDTHCTHVSDPKLALYEPREHAMQLPGEISPHPTRYVPAAQPLQLTQSPKEFPPHPVRVSPDEHVGRV